MKVLLTHISERESPNERAVGLQIGKSSNSEHIIGIPEDKKEGKVSVLLSKSLMEELIEIGWKNHANEGFYLQEFNLVVSAYIEKKKTFSFPIDLSESGFGFEKSSWSERVLRKTKRLLKGNT